MSLACLCILTILIVYQFKGVITGNYAFLWSPISVISLTYLYYIVWTYYTGGNMFYNIAAENNDLMMLGALLSYMSVLWGFSKPSSKDFRSWNNTFSEKNILPSAVLLFTIAFVGYSLCRGIHFTMFSDGKENEILHTGFQWYLIELALMYGPVIGLILFAFKKGKGKKWLWLLVYYAIVSALFKGTRSRIVYDTIIALSVIYLFPKPKRPSYTLLAALMVGLFMLFSVMEYTRSYSAGINYEAFTSAKKEDLTAGASENSSVFWFSSVVMNRCSETSTYYYFEPILTAVFMPIPRFIFPWKPGAEFIRELERLCIGNDEGGAAYLYFVEGFISFGWFGVILYGWFLGWLSRRFWDNYIRNPQSIGAIIAMVSFSASCYGYISRGYLASSVEIFIYMVCLPFWIVKLAGKFSPIFRP